MNLKLAQNIKLTGKKSVGENEHWPGGAGRVLKPSRLETKHACSVASPRRNMALVEHDVIRLRLTS